MTIKQTMCGRPLLAGLAALLIPGLALATPSEEALQACRAVANDAERLACYDAAYSSETPEPVVPPAVEAVPGPAKAPPPAAARPVQLDEEVGREHIDRGVDEDIVIKGHVVRCETNKRGRYHFFFDNGQIWRQKDNTRIPWEECDFEVAIRKDFFGFKMQPAGMDRKVRIARVK